MDSAALILDAIAQNDAIGNEHTATLADMDDAAITKLVEDAAYKGKYGSGYERICERVGVEPEALSSAINQRLDKITPVLFGMMGTLEPGLDLDAYGHAVRSMISTEFMEAFLAGVRYAQDNP